MTASTKPAPDRLFWIKYNPTEWHGMYSELSDEEYGLLHRVAAKLWATPGNRLTLEGLLTDLRIKADSPRASAIRGLVGYALKQSEDGLLFLPAIDDAFTSAISRKKQATTAAAARWTQGTPEAGPPRVPAGTDF